MGSSGDASVCDSTSPSPSQVGPGAAAVLTFGIFLFLQYHHYYWPRWTGLWVVGVHVAVCGTCAILCGSILRSVALRWWAKLAVLTTVWCLAPGIALATISGRSGYILSQASPWALRSLVPCLLLTIPMPTRRNAMADHRAHDHVPYGLAYARTILPFSFDGGTAWRALLASIAYALCAVGATYPGIKHIRTHFLAMDGDNWQMAWNLWWFHEAVFELHTNLYVTDCLFHPTGTSLLLHSLHPFNGLLASPFISRWGVVVAYNVVVLVSLVATGVATYLLAMAATGRSLAAFVAGMIFTLCPRHMYQCASHLNLAAAQWVPVYLLAFIRMHTHRGWLWPLGAALALTLNWTCSWYYLFYCALFSVIFWTYVIAAAAPARWAAGMWAAILARFRTWVQHWRGSAFVALATVAFVVALADWTVWSVRAGVCLAVLWLPWLLVRAFGRGAAVRVGLFMAVSTALLGAPVVLAALSVTEFTGLHTPWDNSADLLGFVLPPGLSSHGWLTGVAQTVLPEGWGDCNCYLGVTVIVLCAVGLARPTVRARCGIWLAVGACFLILALGPQLRIAGRRYFNMPYVLLWRAFPPLKAGGVPGRMAFMAQLCLAAIAAVTLASFRLSSPRRTLLCVLLAVPILVEYLCVPFPTASSEVPRFYREIARDHGDYAIVDSAYGKAMYYQTVHRKKLMGGYIARPEKRAMKLITANSLTRELLVIPKLRSGALQCDHYDIDELRRYGVRYIVDHDRGYRPWLHEELRLPLAYEDDTMDVYDISHPRTEVRTGARSPRP